MVRLREIDNERCEPVVGVAPPTHRGPLGIDLVRARRSYPEQYADAASWDLGFSDAPLFPPRALVRKRPKTTR